MGREAIVLCNWQGETAEVKALLESHALILRGAIRATIARDDISAISVDGVVLKICVKQQLLRLELGRSEAEKWADALRKPLPSLAAKLGLNGTTKAFVFGEVVDAALAAALSGATTQNADSADMLIAIIVTEADLAAVVALALKIPHSPIWCVYGKGKFATLADSTIRSAMRDNGLMDNKTSGVSERMTATRYRITLK